MGQLFMHSPAPCKDASLCTENAEMADPMQKPIETPYNQGHRGGDQMCCCLGGTSPRGVSPGDLPLPGLEQRRGQALTGISDKARTGASLPLMNCGGSSEWLERLRLQPTAQKVCDVEKKIHHRVSITTAERSYNPSTNILLMAESSPKMPFTFVLCPTP